MTGTDGISQGNSASKSVDLPGIGSGTGSGSGLELLFNSLLSGLDEINLDESLSGLSGLSPTASIPIVFVIGLFMGFAILIFVRIAYFYPTERPGSNGIFGDIFNDEFGNADTWRRVFNALDKNKFQKKISE